MSRYRIIFPVIIPPYKVNEDPLYKASHKTSQVLSDNDTLVLCLPTSFKDSLLQETHCILSMNNNEHRDWTWEASPKKEFNRRRLERCFKLDYEESTESSVPSEKLPKSRIKKLPSNYDPMSYKNRPSREPYWNFWRAVFAGWLIRYPMQILKGIGTVIVGLFLFGVLVFSSNMEYNNDINSEVISE